MTDAHDDQAPGGMSAIRGEPTTDSDEPGGMSGIPETDPEKTDAARKVADKNVGVAEALPGRVAGGKP